MYFKLFRPSTRMSKYIRSYYYFYNTPPVEGSPRVNRYPADGGAKLVINLEDPFLAGESLGNLKRFSGCRLLGPLSHRMVSRPGSRTVFLAIRFKPGQVMPFFGVPDRELTNDSTGIESLWGASGRRFIERLTHMNTVQEMFTHVEKKLLLQLQRKQEADEKVAAALDMINQSNGNVQIKTIAKEIHLSVRQFERRFHHCTGLHPKRLCRISRFAGTLSGIKKKAGHNWSLKAIESGYSDQAHLIREFNFFTGQSPERYIANRSPLEAALWSKNNPSNIETVSCPGSDRVLNPLFR